MRFRNTRDSYGLVAILVHWVVALVVIGLFVLGLWMVELTYYDVWYRQAPHIHKSVGILLLLLMLGRVLWRLVNPTPRLEPGTTPLEQALARTAHRLLYLLIFAVIVAGYLISTADGRSVDVFGLFSVPALISGIPNMEDVAGKVHLVLAVTLVSLAGVHALAALKHHFLDKDRTLKRMLGVGGAD